jgi:uncharacterized protein YjbI with pentapeptide repeats
MRTPVELGRRDDLTADCANCFGLCCVALAFSRSADFGFDKSAGEPCVHLEPDYRCEIHPQLRETGFKGCSVFDCFGAGQKVSRQTFGGRSWRDDESTRAAMFATFPLVRRLQELLWYLDVAHGLPGVEALRPRLTDARAEIEALTLLTAEEIGDVDARADEVRPLLLEASAIARSRYGVDSTRRGPDLVGAALSGADLRGADLRGCLLIGADLRGADLRGTDLLGADLRDAQLAGADLSEAIFVTQVQLNSARGDAGTRVPAGLRAPSHWLSD